MKWIAAFGLILQFVAFWLAAPELLGESTLKRLQKGLEKLLAGIPLILLLLIMAAYGGWFGLRGFYLGMQAADGVSFTQEEMMGFYIPLGIATLFYFLLMIFYKKWRTLLQEKMAKPLIQKLIAKQDSRRQALAVGAIFFTVGFLFQLISTLWS